MRYQDAAKLADELYETRLQLSGLDDLSTIDASAELTTVLIRAGEYAEAEQRIRDALARYPVSPQIRNPKLCHLYLRLGSALLGQGKLIEAENAFSWCVKARTDLYGADHTMVAYAKLRLAGVKENLGKLVEAEQLLRESVNVDKNLPSYSRVTEIYLALARVLTAEGKLGEARQILATGRELAEAKL